MKGRSGRPGLPVPWEGPVFVSSPQEPLVLRFDPPLPPPPPEVTHARAMARGADCQKCPLYGCNRGPVLPTIRPGAPLIAIGEAPGGNEVTRKEGFVGASGGILDDALAEGGIARATISVTNTILCQPEGESFADYINALKSAHRKALKKWQKPYIRVDDQELTPARREKLIQERFQRASEGAAARGEAMPDGPPVLVLPQDACRARLVKDLEESASLVMLAVGRQALDTTREILGLAQREEDEEDSHGKQKPKKAVGIKKQHGAPILLPDGRVLMSSYHPAFAMRDKCEYMPVIKENIARAARIARRNGQIDWTEPDYIITPTVQAIERTLHLYLSTKTEVTVDIETDGIDPHVCRVRCVGLGAVVYEQEIVISVPFNHMDGSSWWDPATNVRLALLLRRVLDECPLVFQNGTYDTTVLLRYQVLTRRDKEWDDTLLLHHDTPDNDLPHDLGFITRRYFECPLWKDNVDHKTVTDTSDHYLHLYNCRDVLATMRAVVPLRALVEEWGTGPQYRTDKRVVVRTRDMSELGLICNEWLRGKMSTHLNKQCVLLTKEFSDIVGRPINPRSPRQLQDLFYVDWGYVPVVATDGYEFDPEEDDLEDGSTSNQALSRLQTDRIGRKDHPHYLAVEKLLAFRANDKVRGTNTDNLRTYEVDWDAHGMGHLIGWADPVEATVYDEKLDKDVLKVIIPKRRGLSLVRTTYKGHVVPTGRLASGDPVNFQNITKRARGNLNLRDMYVAPPGHVLVGADYEQIEARLYAIIAQDVLLLEAIRSGLDIHSLNAAALLCKPWEKLMEVYARVLAKPKDERTYIRTVAKRFCFGKIYGAGWEKIFQVMVADRDKATGDRTFEELEEKDCQEWSDNWDRLHPETKIWHAKCHAAFKAYGYTGVPMIDFRKRFFLGGVAQENAIPNMTIQGAAAAIANKALLEISDRIPYRGWSYFSGIVLQVHDYIGVIVPESRWEEAAKIVKEAMYYEYAGMAFPATPEVSWSWGQQ